MRGAPPDSSPTVALPLLTLVRGGMGGSETYVEELSRRLVASPLVDARIFLPHGARGLVSGSRSTVVDGVRSGGSTRSRIAAQLRSETIRAVVREVHRADVVHYPLSVPSPRPSRRQRVVHTLLDTQHHDLRENFTRAEREYRRIRYDRPASRADAIITISDFCKERIVDHLGVPADRVHVAHLGVDATEFTPNLDEPRDPFVLYPARGWPHKNHRRLIAAMEEVRRTLPNFRLVLTGGGLDHLLPLPDWVDVRGLVTRDELLSLYRRASCLAFPSLYEGFGLPPLEAMASGCPVAAGDAGSLREVCGEAAILFDPKDPRHIASGILEAISGGDALAPRGLERVRAFSWERCVATHVDLYRSLATAR